MKEVGCLQPSLLFLDTSWARLASSSVIVVVVSEGQVDAVIRGRPAVDVETVSRAAARLQLIAVVCQSKSVKLLLVSGL